MTRAKHNLNPDRRTHGLTSTYRDGCHCDPCRDAKNAYQRDLAARKRAGRQVHNQHNRAGVWVCEFCGYEERLDTNTKYGPWFDLLLCVRHTTYCVKRPDAKPRPTRQAAA